MKLKYIGADGSMGYRTGKNYDVIIETSGQCIVLYCPGPRTCSPVVYESFGALFNNWSEQTRKNARDLKRMPDTILDEIKNGIHDIYAQNLYCKEDMCNAAMMGYDCEDCLATFILDYIEKRNIRLKYSQET